MSVVLNSMFKSPANSIQFNSIYFQIPNACTTIISQFMKYSYARESHDSNIKIKSKYTNCQIYNKGQVYW